MKKLIFSTVIFQVLLSSYSFAAEPVFDIKKANQEIAEKILTTIGGCGERIWPRYDLKNLNVVLVESNSEELIAVSTKENKIFKINSSELPAGAMQSVYSFFSIDEQKWMSINTEKNAKFLDTYEKLVSETYRLAVHEAFHHIIQDSWKSEASSRGTFVPIKWEPRFYRAMIYKNLFSAYRDAENSQLALQRAKYWFEKWSTEFPEEVLATTDGYEGTAQYSEIMGAVLANLSCNATEENINKYISEELPNNIVGLGNIDGSEFSLDGEGYTIGALASLILRQNMSQPDWHNLVAQGQTSLAILMQKVQQQFEEIDETFKLVFLGTQKKEQLAVDGYLSETYVALKESNNFIISIPHSWRGKGAIGYIGFFVDPTLKIEFSVLGQELNFMSEDKLSNLNSVQFAIYMRLDSPCRQSPWNFTVSSESVSFDASNRLVIENNKFKGLLAGKIKKDKNGRNWFCSGEK